MRSITTSVSLLTFASALMALSIGLSKLAATGGAPMLWYLVAIMVASGLILGGIAWALGHARSVRRSAILFGVISGAFMAAYNAINFLAVEHVGVSFISLTMILPILLTYLLATAFAMDRFDLWKILSVMAGMAGGAVLAAGKFEVSSSAQTIWIILAIANPGIMAASNIYRTRHWPSGASPLLLSALMLFFGGLLSIPFALAFNDIGNMRVFAVSAPLTWNLMLAITIFVIQYPAFLSVQRLSGPVFLSLAGPLIGLFGTAGSLLILGEPAPRGLLLASVLLIGGVAAFQYAQFRQGCDNTAYRPRLISEMSVACVSSCEGSEKRKPGQ